jgi:hypothetical protein
MESVVVMTPKQTLKLQKTAEAAAERQVKRDLANAAKQIKKEQDAAERKLKREKEAAEKKAMKEEAKPYQKISRAEAEKSADEWLPILREWLIQAKMDPEQHRDLGKVLAQAAEIECVKKLDELTGRAHKIVVGKSYDCITDDTNPPVRVQIKFRKAEWHFETTRRNSKKNAETNSTGHIAYSKDEFDMVAIFKPGPTFGVTGSTLRCIPSSALINPAKPDQLVTNISTQIRKIYDSELKTSEVVKMLYHQTPA